MVDPREQHRQLYRRQSNSNYTGNYTGGNRTTTITEITAEELTTFNNFYLLQLYDYTTTCSTWQRFASSWTRSTTNCLTWQRLASCSPTPSSNNGGVTKQHNPYLYNTTTTTSAVEPQTMWRRFCSTWTTRFCSIERWGGKQPTSAAFHAKHSACNALLGFSLFSSDAAIHLRTRLRRTSTPAKPY